MRSYLDEGSSFESVHDGARQSNFHNLEAVKDLSAEYNQERSKGIEERKVLDSCGALPLIRYPAIAKLIRFLYTELDHFTVV